jgi:hypothetical protein
MASPSPSQFNSPNISKFPSRRPSEGSPLKSRPVPSGQSEKSGLKLDKKLQISQKKILKAKKDDNGDGFFDSEDADQSFFGRVSDIIMSPLRSPKPSRAVGKFPGASNDIPREDLLLGLTLIAFHSAL